MIYPTDPDLLSRISEDGWELLLTQLQNDPDPPRGIVRVPVSRRETILRMLSEGHKLAVIASACKVSISLVSRIKNGER